jgi:hypothetical protein
VLPPYGYALLHSYRSKLGRNGGIFFSRALPRAIRIPRASSFGRAARTGDGRTKAVLSAQVAEDESFDRVIAHARSNGFIGLDKERPLERRNALYMMQLRLILLICIIYDA